MTFYLADYLNALTGTELAEIRAALGIRSPTQVLSQTVQSVSIGAVTTEAAALTYTIPAGFLLANDILWVRHLWTITNGADDKIPRTRLGGIAGTIFQSSTQTTSATLSQDSMIGIRSATSQVGGITGANQWGYGGTASAVVTAAINLAIAQDVVISGQKETAGDTMTLQMATIILLRAP